MNAIAVLVNQLNGEIMNAAKINLAHDFTTALKVDDGSSRSGANCTELSSSPYTSTWRWFQAALPTRTGLLPRQPVRWDSVRSVRSRSPPTPNMICRSPSSCSCRTAAPAMKS